MSGPVILAADIGGTKMLAALVDGATLVEEHEVATPRDLPAGSWCDTLAGLVSDWAGGYGAAAAAVTPASVGSLRIVASTGWRAVTSRANVSAIAKPSPLLPPVMIAARPLREISMRRSPLPACAGVLLLFGVISSSRRHRSQA